MGDRLGIPGAVSFFGFLMRARARPTALANAIIIHGRLAREKSIGLGLQKARKQDVKDNGDQAENFVHYSTSFGVF